MTKDKARAVPATNGRAKKPATLAASPVGSREQFQTTFERIVGNIQKVIKGKDEVVRLLLVALVADGNVLLEDMPGTGKTMIARAIAQSINARISRVQCTPDLLPSDITGSPIFDRRSNTFQFREGPVFANVLLVDEINRATPKTQSALLEAMQERRVSVDNQTYVLPVPFLVLATQNPIELAGTFPLPEAQLDRFMFMMHWATGVGVGRAIQTYIVDLCRATRSDPALAMGASSRASQAMQAAARVLAASQGREDVIPDDVKALTKPVLVHRLLLTPDAVLRGESLDNVIDRIIASVKIPAGSDVGA